MWNKLNKRINYKYICFKHAIILIFIPQIAFSQSIPSLTIDDLFTKKERTIVNNGQIISRAYLKNRGTISSGTPDKNTLLPENPVFSSLKGYEMLCTEKAFIPYKAVRESGISLPDLLSNSSKLSGIKYYSISDKKIQTLIEDSRELNNEKKTKEDDDPAFKNFSRVITKYFVITDNRFGRLNFISELFLKDNIFIIRNVCTQPMKKWMISINKKEEYRLIYFFLYDKKAHGFYYLGINVMRIRSDYLLKLGLLTPESFANRMRAQTIYYARLLGVDWSDRLRAFE